MEEAIVFMASSNKQSTACPSTEEGDPVRLFYGSSSGVYILNRAMMNKVSDPLEGSEEDLMISRYRDRDLGKLLNPNWKIPPKELTDRLVRIYFERMNVSFPVLHEALFYAEYRKANPSPDFIPVIITVCRITCCMMQPDDPLLQKHNIHLSTFFDDLTRQCRTYFQIDIQPKIETIQVLVLNSMNTTKLENKDWISISLAVKMVRSFKKLCVFFY
jgi:hypothetical protein